jgi:hypothetical protein
MTIHPPLIPTRKLETRSNTASLTSIDNIQNKGLHLLIPPHGRSAENILSARLHIPMAATASSLYADEKIYQKDCCNDK